jgi:hypothetical protein
MTITRLLAAAAIAGLAFTAPALAQTQDGAAAPEGEAAAPAQRPAAQPLRCEFKVMHHCAPDGTCKQGADIKGMVLPLKVTVDFESGVVVAVDDTGWGRPDRIDAIARSADQLMLHGVDGAFGWQLNVHDGNGAAALTMQTAGEALTAFGSCQK